MEILITPKINPDLDGFACAYAYAQLLNIIDKENHYTAGIYGTPQIEARFLLEKFSIKEGFILNPTTLFDKFIIVDASDIKGMPEVIRSQDVIEVIDHREIHQATEIFPQAKIQIEIIGAAATLIFEKLKLLNFSIDKNSLYLLLGAIFSNTLNFKSDLVSPRDRVAVQSLSNDYGLSIPDDLIDDMFRYKTEYIENNLEEVINSDFKIFNDGLGIAQLEGFDLDIIISNKFSEIASILQKIKEKNNLVYIFLTAADIKNGYNIFLTIDENTQNLLSKLDGLSFEKTGIAKNNKLLLRKQILKYLMSNI
jgi:inorganic pyrophosphatase/exopolyphosphatase